MFIDTFNKYMKDVLKLDFTNVIDKLNEIKQMKEFSDRFFVGYRIIELLNDIYINNKNMFYSEINKKLQTVIKMKNKNNIIRFSELLFKITLINDFLLEKKIYFDKMGFLLIRINKLYFDFSSDNIKLIDELYYFDKNYDFMLSQSISQDEYKNGLFEATEIDLLVYLIIGSLYSNLSINMSNYIEIQELILKSFENKDIKNHNYYCTLLLKNIYNKKTFNNIYHEAVISSISCNNHYIAKIYNCFIFNKSLEEINEAVDLYMKYSKFKLNNPEYLSEKQKIFQINFMLYIYALLKDNHEIANKAFENINFFNNDQDIATLSKIEAHILYSSIKLFLRIFKFKKTSSLLNFIVWFLKITYKEELYQNKNNIEDICLLFNESQISILLSEKFNKDSPVIKYIVEKLK
jgi:hypothetical protein